MTVLVPAHSWSPDSNYPPIPWAAIANNPSGYYDTMRFNLPLPLIAPETLNTLHTTVWAEYFVRTSSLFEDSPFVFFPKHQHPTTEETVSRPEVGTAGGIGLLTLNSFCRQLILPQERSQTSPTVEVC